jgi:hypothetical protein
MTNLHVGLRPLLTMTSGGKTATDKSREGTDQPGMSRQYQPLLSKVRTLDSVENQQTQSPLRDTPHMVVCSRPSPSHICSPLPSDRDDATQSVGSFLFEVGGQFGKVPGPRRRITQWWRLQPDAHGAIALCGCCPCIDVASFCGTVQNCSTRVGQVNWRLGTPYIQINKG